MRAGFPWLGQFKPRSREPHQVHHGEHHRHFHQHAHNGRQRCTRTQTEETDGRGHGQFEKVAGADQGRGSGDAMRHTQLAAQTVSNGGVSQWLK